MRTVGRIIAEQVPADAVPCRYGGDEFAIALAGRSQAEGVRVANALRLAVQASAPVLADVPFEAGTLSISIGLAWRSYARTPAMPVQDVDAEIEELFRAADAALYVAKNGGRNRMHVA